MIFGDWRGILLRRRSDCRQLKVEREEMDEKDNAEYAEERGEYGELKPTKELRLQNKKGQNSPSDQLFSAIFLSRPSGIEQ